MSLINVPNDIAGVFFEVNLRKTKWLIFGTYRSSSHPVQYFFKHVGYALDIYRQTYFKGRKFRGEKVSRGKKFQKFQGSKDF